MKMKILSRTVVILVFLVLCFISGQSSRAAEHDLSQANLSYLYFQVIEGTQPTPELRVLPAIGGNAGLVLGASVLVLIIIGGVVLTARRRAKH